MLFVVLVLHIFAKNKKTTTHIHPHLFSYSLSPYHTQFTCIHVGSHTHGPHTHTHTTHVIKKNPPANTYMHIHHIGTHTHTHTRVHTHIHAHMHACTHTHTRTHTHTHTHTNTHTQNQKHFHSLLLSVNLSIQRCELTDVQHVNLTLFVHNKNKVIQIGHKKRIKAFCHVVFQTMAMDRERERERE